jgi:protein SCO1/2
MKTSKIHLRGSSSIYRLLIINSLVLPLVLLLVAGCKPATTPGDANSGLPTYTAHGVIQKIPADRHLVTIAHDAIPGYMPAMTMDFPVRDTNALTGLSPGDIVNFQLVLGTNDDWVQNLQRVGQTTLATAPAPATDPLKPGDPMPDLAFTTETGDLRHLSDFRGSAVAFTFFFTRCPLPDYCPRMNRNFAATRDLLQAGTNAPPNWQLLSLSFDAGIDTPAILSNYAGIYRGENTNHWLFAAVPMNQLMPVAPRLDLMIMRQNGSISHNLRTIVLDPQGRIHRLFDGNTWLPQQLAAALIEAARQ